MSETRPRAVIHFDEDGWPTFYSDDTVDVIIVDDRAPNDRIYRQDPRPIPSGMLDGRIGTKHDGSPAALEAEEITARLEGSAPAKRAPRLQ